MFKFFLFLFLLFFSLTTGRRHGSSLGKHSRSKGCDPNDVEFELGPFQIHLVCDNLYVFGDGVFQGAFLVTSEGVIVIDGPPQLSPYLETAVSSVTDIPIHTVIYSHSHRDHIGAVGIYKSTLNITYIAHEEAVKLIKKSPNYDITQTPEVTLIISSKYTKNKRKKYKLGNYHLQFWQEYSQHSGGDIYIKFVEQNILYLCDLLTAPFFTSFQGFSLSLDIGEMIEQYKNLYNSYLTEWNVIITSHSYNLCDFNCISKAVEFNNDIDLAVKQAMNSVTFNDAVIKFGGFTKENHYNVLAEIVELIAQKCKDIMNNELGWNSLADNSPHMTESCKRYYYYLFID